MMPIKKVFTKVEDAGVYAFDYEALEHKVAECPPHFKRQVGLAFAAWHNAPFSEPSDAEENSDQVE